jgi:hypothetical protein
MLAAGVTLAGYFLLGFPRESAVVNLFVQMFIWEPQRQYPDEYIRVQINAPTPR